MPQKSINIGTGNNTGDGDALRVAFSKTQDNFQELYSLSPLTAEAIDHSDAAVEGSIAQVIQQLSASGGGIVRLGPGIYELQQSPLEIPANCRLTGSGKGNTILRTSHGNNALLGGVTTPGLIANWSVANLTIELDSMSSASAIYSPPRQSGAGEISNVRILGGTPQSWGVTIDANNVINVTGVTCESNGNGIRFINPLGFQANYGDSLIQHCDIFLTSPNTTGIALESPNNTNNRVNNILISRCEILAGSGGTVSSGTVGVRLKNVARISLVNVDIEHMSTGLIQESATDGGPPAGYNAFIQVYFLGCNEDYLELGSQPTSQTIIGGYGAFQHYQRLSTSNILINDSSLGDYRVLTSAREITKPSAPTVVLTPEQSGLIFTNEAASGDITFQLPPAHSNKSMEFEFHLAAPGSSISVLPSGNDIIRPLQSSTNTALESGTTWGQVLHIRNINAFVWSVINVQGSWS